MKKTIWKHGLLSIEIDCEQTECIVTIRYGSHHSIRMDTLDAAGLRDGLLHISGEIERMQNLLYPCSLCEVDYPESELEDQIGCPPEYVCKHCYETISAKEYDEHVGKLRDKHRLDYE